MTTQTPKTPKSPAGLDTAGKRLWRAVHADFEGFNPAEVVVIEHACRTVDVCDQLAKVVAADGVTTSGSKGQTVIHPALAELRQQRKLAADMLRQLGLPDPDEITGAKSREWKARRAARARWS